MPVAGFTIKTDTSGSVTIADVSTGSVGTFDMDWGDGYLSNAPVGSTLSHTYASVGYKTMTQTVYDAQNVSAKLSQTATVGLGTASFTKGWDVTTGPTPFITITDTSQEPYDSVICTVGPQAGGYYTPTINFTNNSHKGIEFMGYGFTSWLWEFGDGDIECLDSYPHISRAGDLLRDLDPYRRRGE